MELRSLKQSTEEWEQPAVSGGEHFPTVYLDSKSIDALKLGTPKVGTMLRMEAVVRVSSVNDSSDGSRSVTLEIQEAGLAPKEEKPDPASVLFPNG